MKIKNIITGFILLGIICVGCSTNSTKEDKSPEEVSIPDEKAEIGAEDDNEKSVPIHIFAQEEITVKPEIMEYNFKTAQEIGIVQKIDGILPGSDEGTWYIVEIDGIEYYYGKYNTQKIEETMLFGYSIVSDKYSLANGISVGMTKEEMLLNYPNMAVIDFEGNDLNKEVTGHQGWNGISYPRSYIDMDSDWEYKGENYFWTNQFEYVMIADIDLEESDILPQYVAFLMVDDAIAAITFYCPTAG